MNIIRVILLTRPRLFKVAWLTFRLKSISWIELVGFFAGKFIHQGIDTTVVVLVVWVYLDTHHRTTFEGVCSK